MPFNDDNPTVISELSGWWREHRPRAGFSRTALKLSAIFWEFLRDSMPDRRRQRFGDADYDWEHRVNTTSANVSWHARLIGLLNSSYQPIESDLFEEMLNSLGIDYTQFTFIDIGSGKGRPLLMASEYPFRRIMGVELLPELNRIALENIRNFPKERQRCTFIQAIAGDATRFVFPSEPLVVFMFHPLPESGFRSVLANLQRAAAEGTHPVWLIYANPLFDAIVRDGSFRKIRATHQYSIYLASS